MKSSEKITVKSSQNINMQSFIVDRRIPKEMINKLKIYGNVYLSAPISEKISYIGMHPDIQIHFVSKDTAYTAPMVYDYYTSVLPKDIKLIKGKTDIGGTYPKDCAYNIARIGNNIICNTNIAEKTILDYYTQNNYNIINIKQGYSKCNICPISNNLFITEDLGIAKAVNIYSDIKAYVIPVGSVKLNGFKYGFIGGATGLTCDKRVIFCGNPHNNNTLSEIIKYNNIKTIILSDEDLYDYGTVICF